MAEARHGKLTVAEGIHIAYQWSYADATARTGASGFVAADVGKLARQVDTSSLWMLTATTPTWIEIGGSSAPHAAVTLGGGSDAALSLSGQQLTLADVLTPTEHTAIGNGSPHHAAVTLDANADTLLSLSTQALGLDTQAANMVWAGPASGAAAVPTPRSLVSADLPSIWADARFGMALAWVNDDTISVSAGACAVNGALLAHTAANYTFTALDTGSRTVGRDYSVHMTADGIKLHLIPVDNSGLGALYPSGYAAATSRLLGYFHNGPKADGTVGAGRNQAIFPYSVSNNTLLNESYPYRAHPDLPAGIPLPGMVRVGATAIGIYLASREDATASAQGSSSYPTSRYGMVPLHSLSGWASMMVTRHVGCRLPTWEEWLGAVQFNPGSTTPALSNGNTYYGSASDDSYLAAPGALTSALAGAGAGLLGNGVYKYRVTLVNAAGETQGGTANAGTTVADYTTNGQMALSAIPTGAAGTTARKLYRTVAGGAVYKLHVAGTAALADNITTTYTDNTADADLGATVAEINTTGAQQGAPDPTHNAGRTLTGTGPRTTEFVNAAGRSWYTPAGLADPVGNIWEWVNQFFGGLRTSSPGAAVAWGYNGDYGWNFQGQSYNPDTGGWTEGLPALLLVGGIWDYEAYAGVRTAYANYSPGNANTRVGFRLAR